ncbi:ImmA/IrrE family metallo-endopeptidase [Actinacidiphila glaucinigra]|uniref:ImmA/IrrE family metallo-endopeptidase n=1 Tax=Actinacidiphila glaucinigra TaxID=235986 RepID=UPI00371FFE14
MTLPRGFKANAEREAVRLRKELGLTEGDPLSVRNLADHLGVKIVSAESLIDLERLEELERLQAYAFSAATFEIAGRHYVVTNPLRPDGRQASDIAHELSHLLLKHDLSEVRELSGTPFRTCQPEEEEQATAFGGTLMLPRPLLLSAARRGMGPTEIAAACGVSEEMARYRYNTTGVAKQARTRSG